MLPSLYLALLVSRPKSSSSRSSAISPAPLNSFRNHANLYNVDGNLGPLVVEPSTGTKAAKKV